MLKIFTKGLIKENPIFVLVLGLCPTLAVTTSVMNAIGMGVATTLALIGCNVMISAIKSFIPSKIRIPCYIVIITSFCTVIDLVMAAYTPDLHKALGIFIPLIAVNCIVLGRAEAFACKNTMFKSALDGAGTGLGFTGALTIIGFLRELLGTGKLFDIPVLWPRYIEEPMLIAILAPGAFIILGLLLATMNLIRDYKHKKAVFAQLKLEREKDGISS